jgi:hypothetical protein
MIRKLRGPKLEFGPFSLGRWGLPINLLSLFYLLFVILWMPFPSVLPVTRETMNYAGPVFLVVITGALVDWFINGHKRFEVPAARPGDHGL